MSDLPELTLETLQCATNATGETVYMALGGHGFEHQYKLPTNRLGRFIEHLLKVYNTSRASGALAGLAKQKVVPPVQPVIESFLVNDMSLPYRGDHYERVMLHVLGMLNAKTAVAEFATGWL